MSTSAASHEGEFGFQIAPMVDVVFVLLLFFMAFASLKQYEHRIPATIPNGVEGVPVPTIVVDISSAGAVSANGMLLVDATDKGVEGLDVWLKKVAGSERDTPFVLRPAPDATHGRFLQVYGTLHKGGFKKVAFH
jgi:biopolymer transport protein ExbD